LEHSSKILAGDAQAILTDFPTHRLGPRGKYMSRLTGKDVSTMLEVAGLQSVTDAEVASFRAAVEQIAADVAIPLVRYGEVLDQYPDQMMTDIDGVHPSAIAHRLIARELMRILTPTFQQEATASRVRESRRYARAG
jgi:lysophospholipase L1-like esterase